MAIPTFRDVQKLKDDPHTAPEIERIAKRLLATLRLETANPMMAGAALTRAFADYWGWFAIEAGASPAAARALALRAADDAANIVAGLVKQNRAIIRPPAAR